MIIKSSELAEANGRKDYGIGRFQEQIEHFVVRVTRPENPFGPHGHEAAEFWFILEGEAIVTLDGQESPVAPGDLVVLAPWSMHGLRSETAVRWACFG